MPSVVIKSDVVTDNNNCHQIEWVNPFFDRKKSIRRIQFYLSEEGAKKRKDLSYFFLRKEYTT